MCTLHPRLLNLAGLQDSFLGRELREYPNHGFLPHYLYFLDNLQRWCNSEQLQKRILAPVSTAWGDWIQFRSAQAEITSMYLLENYLCAEVRSLEVSPPGYSKSCDICAQFRDGKDTYLEVKAQSGQQHAHGNTCPLSAVQFFSPQSEGDLLSWLFESRVSSTTGKAMVPYCLQACAKGADVLIAMDDIFQVETSDFCSLGKRLVPDSQYLSKAVFPRKFDGGSEPDPQATRSITAILIGAGKQTTNKMGNLREVWVFDNSALNELLVIRAAGVTNVLPDVAPRAQQGTP